jgi:ADP-heptose:LPS heptosyltransferase
LRHNLEFFFPESRIHLFPALPEQGRDLHVALYLAQGLAKAGLALAPEKAWATAFERPLLDQTEPGLTTRGPVFHPGSGSSKKNLPPDFWVALIQAVRRASGFQEAILLLGPAEEPLQSYFRATRKEHGAEIINTPDNQALLRILKEAAFYIGHDSGITHLAALLGRPCIALFKESSLAQWRPLGRRVEVVQVQEPLDAVIMRVLQAYRSLLIKGNKVENKE